MSGLLKIKEGGEEEIWGGRDRRYMSWHSSVSYDSSRRIKDQIESDQNETK